MLFRSKKKRARKDEEDKFKRFTMDNISVNRRTFRQKVIPTYIEFMMSLENPFDLHNDKAVEALRRIFNFVFPEEKQLVTEEDPIKYLVSIFVYSSVSLLTAM